GDCREDQQGAVRGDRPRPAHLARDPEQDAGQCREAGQHPQQRRLARDHGRPEGRAPDRQQREPGPRAGRAAAAGPAPDAAGADPRRRLGARADRLPGTPSRIAAARQTRRQETMTKRFPCSIARPLGAAAAALALAWLAGCASPVTRYYTLAGSAPAPAPASQAPAAPAWIELAPLALP